MTTPDTTVSVSSTLLRRHLTAVLPHAGVDDTLPVLASVRIEIRAGYLYLAATDRYTMGVTRLRIPAIPDRDRATQLACGCAREMRRLLKTAGGPVALTFGDGHLTLDAGRNRTATWGTEDNWVFPDWRPLIAKMLAADPAELGDRHGINPDKLARFCDGSALDPLNLWVTNGSSRQVSQEPPEPAPVLLVTRGDWFAGCMMPTSYGTVNDAAASAATWGAWAGITEPAEAPEAAAL
jgi:DNA polymerase III beta subunit, central domain